MSQPKIVCEGSLRVDASSGSPGAAGRIVLQDPVNVRDVDASGHDVRTHQDPTAAEGWD